MGDFGHSPRAQQPAQIQPYDGRRFRKSTRMRSGVLPVGKERFKHNFNGKVDVFCFLCVFYFTGEHVCFFLPAITLKGGFDHASIHLDRGLVSLGFSRCRQDGRRVA